MISNLIPKNVLKKSIGMTLHLKVCISNFNISDCVKLYRWSAESYGRDWRKGERFEAAFGSSEHFAWTELGAAEERGLTCACQDWEQGPNRTAVVT